MNKVKICLNSWRILWVTLPPVWNVWAMRISVQRRQHRTMRKSSWITCVELWFEHDWIPVAFQVPAIYLQWEFSYMCLHSVTSFGVCVPPMCPCTVFNITPTKWDHMRHEHMKHMWGFHFALFSRKASSWPGLHIGYEKNLTSRGSARKSPVQYNLMSYSNNHTENKIIVHVLVHVKLGALQLVILEFIYIYIALNQN